MCNTRAVQTRKADQAQSKEVYGIVALCPPFMIKFSFLSCRGLVIEIRGLEVSLSRIFMGNRENLTYLVQNVFEKCSKTLRHLLVSLEPENSELPSLRTQLRKHIQKHSPSFRHLTHQTREVADKALAR